MGQKVNPKSMRLKINEKWSSLWYSKQNYTENLISDLKIRKALALKLKDASVSDIQIKRDSNKITLDIYSGRPGIIIGRGGAGTDELKKFLAEFIKERVQINIIEVKKPDADSSIIAQNIAHQLEKRVPYKKAIRQAIEKAKTTGIKGMKIQVSGRLNGVDIARTDKASFGTVPLSTFKSDINYRSMTALTTYGIIGIRVWVYNGERLMNGNDF